MRMRHREQARGSSAATQQSALRSHRALRPATARRHRRNQRLYGARSQDQSPLAAPPAPGRTSVSRAPRPMIPKSTMNGSTPGARASARRRVGHPEFARRRSRRILPARLLPTRRRICTGCIQFRTRQGLFGMLDPAASARTKACKPRIPAHRRLTSAAAAAKLGSCAAGEGTRRWAARNSRSRPA